MLGGLPSLPVLDFLVTLVHSLASTRAAEQNLLLPSSTLYGATSTVALVAATVALSASTVAL
jgi:hypothetical protein